MKTVFSSLLLILFPFIAMAQQQDSTTNNRRLYVGVGFSTVSYHLYYKSPKTPGSVTSGYFAPVSVNVGYKLSERATVQVGLAYGGSKDHNEWSPEPNNAVTVKSSSVTNVFATPVTARYVLFNLYKPLQVFGTATLTPAFGATNSKTTETRGTTTETVEDVEDAGTNVFLVAGAGVNYKIGKRFSGVAEYIVYKQNLSGKNSFYYDWNQGFKGFLKYTPRWHLG